MNVEESLKIDVDYTKEVLPKSVRKLQPLVWKDNELYRCLLGPDLNTGISGTGETPLRAIVEWDTQLTARLAQAEENDEVIQYVKDVYKADNTEVW